MIRILIFTLLSCCYVTAQKNTIKKSYFLESKNVIHELRDSGNNIAILSSDIEIHYIRVFNSNTEKSKEVEVSRLREANIDLTKYDCGRYTVIIKLTGYIVPFTIEVKKCLTNKK